MVLLLALSAHAQSVAVYFDNPFCLACDAVALRGYDASLFLGDGPGFEDAAATADVAIVESISSPLPSEVADVVAARTGARRPLLFSYWDLDADPGVAADLGVSAASYSIPTPLMTHGDAPVDLLAGLGGRLDGATNDAGDNGDFLTLTGDGWEAAHDDAGRGTGIVVTHGDTTVVNGFLPWDYQGTDLDGDGTNDAVEVYFAELDLVLAAAGPALALAGACPGPVDVTITGLTPGGDVAVAVGPAGLTTIPRGPCAGTDVAVGAPRVFFRTADGGGTIAVTPDVRPALCGQRVQAIDLATCATTGSDTL